MTSSILLELADKVEAASGPERDKFRCQGWQPNLGAYFIEGQRRAQACTHPPEFRVFTNPPKGDDDGTRLACRICADFTWTSFRREPLNLRALSSQEGAQP